MSTITHDARQDMRVPTNKKGTIRFGAAGHELPCTVTDLTSLGAGITLVSAFGVPQTFQLKIKGEPEMKHCREVWVKGTRLGVSFD